LNVHGFIPVPHAPTLMFIAHCTWLLLIEWMHM
jgi:hypothetical protein